MEPEATRRSPLFPPRLVAGLTLTAAFLVGIALGVTLDRVALRHHGHRHWFADRPFGPPSESERREHAARMAKELNLTSAQAVAVDSILAGRTRQLEAGRARFETEMRALMGATRRQIDSLLTPEQRKQLEALRLRHRHKRPGP